MAGTFTQQLWNQAKELLTSIELEPQLIQGVVENYMKSFSPIIRYLRRRKLQNYRMAEW